MNNKLEDKRILKVLTANILLRAAKIIFSIFLNIYIWKISGDIRLVAIYNLVYLSSHTIFFLIGAKVVKNGYRTISHVGSLIGYALVSLSIVILRENTINYIFYIGFFVGIFNGWYWITYHNNQFELTHYHNRGNYEGLKHVGDKLVKIIVPSFIGVIISLNYFGLGYEIAFSFSTIFLLLAAFVGKIKIDEKDKVKYDFGRLVKRVFKNKRIMVSLFGYTLTGFSFSNSLLEVIIPILLFSYIGSEAGLGFLVSFFAIASIIGAYIFGKYVSYKYYKYSLLVSGFIYGISLFGFIEIGVLKYMVIFSALINFVSVFFSIPQKVTSDSVLHDIKDYKNYRSEYMVLREIFLAVGWIGSYTCIYIIGSLEIEQVRIIFYFMIGAIFLSAFSLSRINIHREK
ncbi:MAG: MFS transporter [Candidatus Gracilibacteria bacterium]